MIFGSERYETGIVADVSGHGIGPALLMASVHMLLRMVAESECDPGSILTRANRAYVEITREDRFVTTLFACLDVESRCLTYANAGHPSGFVLSKDGN